MKVEGNLVSPDQNLTSLLIEYELWEGFTGWKPHTFKS
jgi:hypothetical protein